MAPTFWLELSYSCPLHTGYMRSSSLAPPTQHLRVWPRLYTLVAFGAKQNGVHELSADDSRLSEHKEFSTNEWVCFKMYPKEVVA